MKKSLLFAATIATCSAANAGLFDVVKTPRMWPQTWQRTTSAGLFDFKANQTGESV